MEQKTYVIDKENEKLRLDVFLEKQNKGVTRSHLKKQIENGEVLVNNKTVKAGYSLKVGDEVVLHLVAPKEVSLEPVNLNLDIVYQDNDLAVINKPQGMVVHPAVGNYDNTLVNALLFEIKDLSGINGEIRPGIVHRLDKDTSGLLIIAKNDSAHVHLSRQIQTKSCKRHYLALVNGNLKNDSGVITSYIARDKKNRLKMAVNFNNEGKYAETHYKVVTRYHGYTLVEFELKTGRTHQIRVHASHLGHPVVGDAVYGNTKNKFDLKGQLLHSYRIAFEQPTDKKYLEFEVRLPEYFEKVLTQLKPI